MPKELYLLDSTYATKNYDSIIGNYDNNFYHTFNICFPLKKPLQNLKSITLRSVEIPVVLNNIRPLNGSSNYTNINITVSDATAAYTGTNTILSAINTAVGNAIVPYGSLTVNFTLSTGAAGFQVCQILTNASNFVLNQSTLATMIGFYIILII